jgi:hypothetical protein
MIAFLAGGYVNVMELSYLRNRDNRITQKAARCGAADQPAIPSPQQREWITATAPPGICSNAGCSPAPSTTPASSPRSSPHRESRQLTCTAIFLARDRNLAAFTAGDVVTAVLPEQRKDTYALLRKAGIHVTPQQVAADSAAVHALVGEIAPDRPPAPKPAPSQPARRRRRSNRPQRNGRR